MSDDNETEYKSAGELQKQANTAPMSLSDFLDACEEEGIENFPIVLNRPYSGSERMHALPGVMGTVLCENSDGNAVVSVKVKDVRRYLNKHIKAVSKAMNERLKEPFVKEAVDTPKQKE